MSDSEDKQMQELAVRWTQAQPAVSAFITSMVPSFHDAEDILQRVAVSLAQKFSSYDRDKSFLAWSIGIARIEILRYRRSCARDKHIFNDTIVDKVAGIFEESGDELSGLREALQKCVGQVKGRARELLELRYVRELKPGRIARQIGMTPNAVFVALHRLRVILKECINRQIALGKREL